MVDFDSIMEAAQDAIDVVLDKSAEEDADVDFEASTEVDDQALDAVIGFTDNVLISDKDIEDIDAGKEPGDYDPVDVDAREAEQDEEIKELEQDVTANALVTKDDIKDLKEGASIYDYVDKVINEDVGDIPFSLNDENTGKVCEFCHHVPCECGDAHVPHTAPHTTELVDKDVDTDGEILGDDGVKSDAPIFKMNPTEDNDTGTDNVPGSILTDADPKQGASLDHNDDVVLPPNIDIEDDIDDDTDLDDVEPDTFDNTPEKHTTVDLTSSNAPANEPAGPVVPLTDGTRPGTIESHEEGDLNMFEDEDLNASLEETFEELEDSVEVSNEDVKGKDMSSDGSVEDLFGAMGTDDLDDVEMFNDFEGSDINAETERSKGFLKGMDKNVDEPSGSFNSQDSLNIGREEEKMFDLAQDANKVAMTVKI